MSLKLKCLRQRCLSSTLFLKNQVDIRSEDVGNAEDVLTLSDLGTERDSNFLGGSNLLGGLWIFMSVMILLLLHVCNGASLTILTKVVDG